MFGEEVSPLFRSRVGDGTDRTGALGSIAAGIAAARVIAAGISAGISAARSRAAAFHLQHVAEDLAAYLQLAVDHLGRGVRGDEHTVALDPVFQAGEQTGVTDDLAQGHVGEVEGHGRLFAAAGDVVDLHALLVGVVFLAAAHQILERLVDLFFVPVDLGKNDGVQLAVDLLVVVLLDDTVPDRPGGIGAHEDRLGPLPLREGVLAHGVGAAALAAVFVKELIELARHEHRVGVQRIEDEHLLDLGQCRVELLGAHQGFGLAQQTGDLLLLVLIFCGLRLLQRNVAAQHFVLFQIAAFAQESVGLVPKVAEDLTVHSGNLRHIGGQGDHAGGDIGGVVVFAVGGQLAGLQQQILPPGVAHQARFAPHHDQTAAGDLAVDLSDLQIQTGQHFFGLLERGLVLLFGEEFARLVQQLVLRGVVITVLLNVLGGQFVIAGSRFLRRSRDRRQRQKQQQRPT